MAILATDQMRLSVTSSSDGSVDFVQILGDVDLSDSRQLDLAARRLTDSAAATVFVDLGGNTFMGSTLIAFLVHIAQHCRTGAPLILCRATETARRVIHMTGLDALTGSRPDLPPGWPGDAAEPDPSTGHLNERPRSP